MAKEVLAGMAEDMTEDSEEASAVVAEGSQVDRATEEATMAGEVRGEQAAPAATGAASGATAGGREACGPIAEVHNQEHVAVFFWFSILFFLLMCFVLSHPNVGHLYLESFFSLSSPLTPPYLFNLLDGLQQLHLCFCAFYTKYSVTIYSDVIGHPIKRGPKFIPTKRFSDNF